MEVQAFIQSYRDDLSRIVSSLDVEALERAVLCLRTARDQGKTVFTCGNGGSASIASEMVVDLIKGASLGKEKRFRIIGLSDSIATITAYANDVSYEAVFVEQLKNWVQPGDVLIAISGSGNSPNVLRAVEYANLAGCATIGCTSGQSGKLRELASLPLLVPSRHMGRLEDCFYAITHVLCYAFIEDHL